MARKKTTKTANTTDLAEPQNRTEEFLANIAGLVNTLPSGEFSRLERYLKYIAENGGGGGGGVTSFNGRTGAVVPVATDYSPAFIGAQVDMGYVEDTTYAGCWYQLLTGDVKEWLNPPLVEGTEYRTTERYNGKPVYVKAVSATVPSAQNTNATTQFGITNLDSLVRGCIVVNGVYSSNALKYAIPYKDASGNEVYGGIVFGGNKLSATIAYTSATITLLSGTAIAYYTKTTD